MAIERLDLPLASGRPAALPTFSGPLVEPADNASAGSAAGGLDALLELIADIAIEATAGRSRLTVMRGGGSDAA